MIENLCKFYSLSPQQLGEFLTQKVVPEKHRFGK